MKNIGVYAGSFNPFHSGHSDIANKAKRIFDEVWIVKAINPNKPIHKYRVGEYKLPHCVKACFRVIETKDLITDLIKEHSSSLKRFTLIRGLRNEKDFAYEENLCAAYRELMPTVNIVHIFSDPKYNHISSSLLREYGHLPEFNKYILK